MLTCSRKLVGYLTMIPTKHSEKRKVCPALAVNITNMPTAEEVCSCVEILWLKLFS